MARVHHGQADWMCYHITTRTADQRFYLGRPEEKQRILSALAFYRRRGRYRIFGFVVMSNHVHVLLQPDCGQHVGDILRDFKAWTSRQNTSKPRGAPLWERRYDDNEIHSTRELRHVLVYIHNNPVRAGLAPTAESYPWSSVHNYLDDGRQVIEVDADWWR